MPDTLNFMKEKFCIPENIINKLYDIVNQDFGVKLSDISIINLENPIAKNIIFIHSEEDKISDINYVKEIIKKWNNSTLIRIENSNHYDILKSKETLINIKELLNNTHCTFRK